MIWIETDQVKEVKRRKKFEAFDENQAWEIANDHVRNINRYATDNFLHDVYKAIDRKVQ